ncbi:MAG: hypothetical protein ACLQGU_10560 [bacterium]
MEGGRIAASKIARSKIIPNGIGALKAEDLAEVENRISDEWVWYMESLKAKRFGLVNHIEKTVKVILAIWSSRYHVNGQAKQKVHIMKALGHYYFKFGVMVTLTFDPKRATKLGAWCVLGYRVRAFIDKINKWRGSRGLSKIKGFLHVNEDQPGSGYPAPHIVFPGLKYLAPHDVVAELWGHGFIKVNVGGSVHPAEYACKYITKMKGKDFMMAMMWFFNIRTYTFSRVFKYRGEDKASSEWEFLRRGRGKGGGLESLEDAVKRFRDEGHYIFNIGLLGLRAGYTGVFGSG